MIQYKYKEGVDMTKEIKISKNMIVETAFNLCRKYGLEVVSNRMIAKELNCSIRPIYYQFSNTEELKNEVYLYIEEYFYKYIMDNMIDNIPYYKQIGINYIKFAREESNLFKILFMSSTSYLPDGFVAKNENGFKKIENFIKLSTKLSDKDIKPFHIKMWIYTHGIATLIATGTVSFDDDKISELLSSEFQALMLLEDNPDNKWKINDKKDWRDGNE